MKFGLSSYAFGWAIGVEGFPPPRPLDEHGLLRWASEMNASAIQIADNLPLETFSEQRLAVLIDAAHTNHIDVEVGARRLTRSRLELYANIARQVGSSFVRFVIDDRDYHPSLEAVEQEILASLPNLQGVTLAIENHDRFAARDLRRLVERLDSERVAICLDTANSLGAGEGIEMVLRELGPWVVNVHLKDIAIRRVETMMGFIVEGRPAGAGQIDMPALLAELKRYGRCQSATLELWTPRAATLDETIEREAQWVRQSCQFLQPLLSQVTPHAP